MASPLNKQGNKISPEFEARLSGLPSKKKIRAVVLIENQGRDGKDSQPVSRAAMRRRALSAAKRSAKDALPQLDNILLKHDGRKLAPSVDALGSIAVETTPAGIRALAKSIHVKAILEDQAITLIS